MIYCMRKLQSSIEKFILSAIVAVVAIIVSYFIYSSFYSTSSHIGLKSYLTQADFNNIYGNKTSIFILLKNNTEIGSNVLINEKITFSNGTSSSITVPFTLEISSQSGDGHLYYFTTSNFPTIANNSQGIKISNINILSENSIIESQNNSISYSSYYYTKASLATVPLYYLNMSTSILNAGVITPGNGYYYAGSKIAIGEKPNTGYAFAGWLGYGNGNYTGSNQTSIITMNSNITEYAKYVKLVKMYVNATYNGIPVYVNGVLNTTTNGTIYLMPGSKYTISFPMYIPLHSGIRYAFENMQDDCGILISQNSNSTSFVASYANYNCKFTANYVEQYLLLIDVNSSQGSVTPFGGWYDAGSNVEITVTSNYGYAFGKVIGNGDGSYTGTDNPFYVRMNSPITENVVFIPLVNVYVKSSSQSVPYSFLSSYNNTFYKGTTNSNFMAPAGSTLTLESTVQVNWGEREFISISSSTCTSSGNSITLPTTGGASCIIYINPPTIQYLFIMNEFLNSGNKSNNLQYGSVYVDGSQMTSNQTWINAGTYVTFYATNDKAGYAFQDFTGTNSSLNGVSYIGISGVDSNPGVPVGTNQQYTYTASGPPYQVQNTYTDGYNLTDSMFGGAWEEGWIPYAFDLDAPQYVPIHIIMNSPVIENANYYLTRNITGNTVNVVVNYKYYNITEQTTSYNYNNWQNYGYQTSPIRESSLSRTENITISNVTPYSNYSSGIGKEIVYYLNSASYYNFYTYQYSPESQCSGCYYLSYYEYTNTYSFAVSNFTSQHLSYMPQEYNYVVNQIISDIESQYPDKSIRYNSSIVYILNLQLSFNLSGTQVYIDYEDTPTSTIWNNNNNVNYGGPDDLDSTSTTLYTNNYFGYSNYYTNFDGFLQYR